MSQRSAVLGVDFGSTTAKATLVAADGRVLGRATRPQRVDRAPDGTAEQSPDGWWRDLRALVREVATSDAAIAGIGISGHLPTLVLADESGTPLAPAMLYADRRADAFIERARELSGQRLNGDELLPKLLWLAANRPDRLWATQRLFNLADWLTHRLTGERAVDVRTAMRSGLFDPGSMAWRTDLVVATGLDPAALPPVRPGDAVVGGVGVEAAADLGVPSGTPVLVGLGDTPAELIGCGVIRAGEAMVYYGTTTTLDVATHDVARFFAEPRLIGEWAPYREVGYAVLGPAIGWAAGGLASAADRAGVEPDLAALDAAAAALTPDPDAPFVVPSFEAHVAGTGHAPSAIVGLQPGHGRADLHRAMLESFGFAARAGLEASGLAESTRRFVAAGGGARSAFWRQLLTDTLGAAQSWPTRSDASLGMAMLAARPVFGADIFGADLATWLGPVERTEPDPSRVVIQAERYRRWLKLCSALAGVAP
jgi:xylulokinase